MNFFTVGFVLLSINLDFDMPLNYALKLAGVFFMYGGVKEIDSVSDGFSRLRPLIAAVCALSTLGLAGSLLTYFGLIGGMAGNIISIVLGAGTVAAVLYTQYVKIIKLMLPRHELVNDPSLLVNLAKTWKKLAIFTALGAAGDVLNRLLPVGNAQVYASVVLVIARVIMIIYIFCAASAFNKVRMDFNAVHPV